MTNTIRLITTCALPVLLSGCSLFGKLDRRPFADEVGYMVLQKPTRTLASVGDVTAKDCHGFLFGVIPMNDEPTFNSVKEKMIEENQIVALQNATTYTASSNWAGIWKDNCLYLKGVGLK